MCEKEKLSACAVVAGCERKVLSVTPMCILLIATFIIIIIIIVAYYYTYYIIQCSETCANTHVRQQLCYLYVYILLVVFFFSYTYIICSLSGPIGSRRAAALSYGSSSTSPPRDDVYNIMFLFFYLCDFFTQLFDIYIYIYTGVVFRSRYKKK